VITVTARQPDPSEGSAVVTGQLVTTLWEVLLPDQVPFSARLLQPFKSMTQGAGVGVRVTVRVGVNVGVQVLRPQADVGVKVGVVATMSP
jgi:hypothetical protein